MIPARSPVRVMSAVSAMSRGESGLPPTPERLRQRSEPTLRAITGSPVLDLGHSLSFASPLKCRDVRATPLAPVLGA
jgi:hypothetical protein